MPTERLYYTDSYLTEFDATVEHIEHAEGRLTAILNRSAFYPTSGGQPFDTGTLNDIRVVEVIEAEDGSIRHVVERPLQVGAHVHGVIDWRRRFDHMQQHSGQHLLSAAFDRLFQARTVSFHLGDDASTIDLNRDLAVEQITAAQADANRVIWDDRPVAVRFVDVAEVAAIGLRKESSRTGTLRIVDIPDYDRSACGGTHVARTGAVGIIAIQSWERFKGGTRVGFVCGHRALNAFAALRDIVGETVRRLSTLPADVPAAIDRIEAEAKDLRKQLRAGQERLARYEAAELIGRAAVSGRAKLVAEIIPADASLLKLLGAAVVAHPGCVVIVVSAAASPLVTIGRSKDVSLDARDLLHQLIQRFGGKGGGSAEMAHGGGFRGSAEEVLATAAELARSRLTSEIS